MIRGALHAFVALFVLTSAARAGPEFRVATGLLMLFDGGKTTPLRYNTQTDLNFTQGGSVRVFSTVTPEGLAEVEILARSKVDFYFLGADVALAPSGTIRASVENLKHPAIKLTWDGGSATASRIVQTPEELLSYFIVSQPPVFSKSPIGDDELSKIYPQNPDTSQARTPDAKDEVEVDLPVSSRAPSKAPVNPAKPSVTPNAVSRPKGRASPTPRSHPSQTDKDLLATSASSSPAQAPAPPQKTEPAIPKAVAPETVPQPTPSPELIPDLPKTLPDLPAPDGTSTGQEGPQNDLQTAVKTKKTRQAGKEGAAANPFTETPHVLKALLPDTTASSPPASLTMSHPRPPLAAAKKNRQLQPVAAAPIEPLDCAASQTPKAMPQMHLPIASAAPEFLPIIPPGNPRPEATPKPERPVQPYQDRNKAKDLLRPVNVERPTIVLGGQKEFMPVLRALPVDKAPGLPQQPAQPQNVPDPVVLTRQLATALSTQATAAPFVISSGTNPLRVRFPGE